MSLLKRDAGPRDGMDPEAAWCLLCRPGCVMEAACGAPLSTPPVSWLAAAVPVVCGAGNSATSGAGLVVAA